MTRLEEILYELRDKLATLLIKIEELRREHENSRGGE